jgi:hypothetical protein
MQRRWGNHDTLLDSLRRYGRHGADGPSYIEGILARLVEAASGCTTLPSIGEPGFLCGMEFSSVAEERAHFARHALALDPVEVRVALSPGELLLFDNLATAHGRIGTRKSEELHQICVGYGQLDVLRQHVLVRRVLDAFGPGDAPGSHT